MSVVEFALELAGDVSSFTPSVRTEMKSAIAARGGVDPSAVELTVTSGSVIVGVRILTPTVMATSVQLAMASATSNASSATAMLASVTGVSIAVLAVVTPPTTTADVAPPPPPPPNAPFIISAGGGEINISSSSLVIASLATASSEGALHAVEVQGASPSIGGAAPVVMPRLGEDSIVLHISPTAIANFYSEFEAELDA
ncbi:hypothetical protein Ctob_016389 [Chrysochromulina tobinii]|uniref:Uncharacterized protein n=1 Tax=Chrysochromulina tobinii TaxID=1460289 RepID=A0A0M0LQQ0_9EUKA|nr:hypothetical protein Ctob_016389 [Chrysochromulina tobinii]|eukprot:KOO53369.1 hypothetical protein Ctob_016389 [Chrysochromulina sp. CCMP291]